MICTQSITPALDRLVTCEPPRQRRSTLSSDSKSSATELWPLPSCICVLSFIALAATPRLNAGTVVFTKIAETNTAAPGTSGTFTSFDRPATSEGKVLFEGDWTVPGTNAEAMFLYDPASGRVSDIADTTHGYTNFNGYSLDGPNAVFNDLLSPHNTLYRYSLTSQQTAVLSTEQTLVPSADGKLTGQLTIIVPTADGGSVAGNGIATNIGQGIYTNVSGSFRPIADHTTAAPGHPGSFFTAFVPGTLRVGKVAFAATFPLNGSLFQTGLYIGDTASGTLTRIVDTTMQRPGGGTWGGFGGQPAFDGSSVSFIDQATLYTTAGGSPRVVADTSTLIPGTSIPFAQFSEPAMDGGRIAFTGSATVGGPPGLFLWDNDVISEILPPARMLDGKAVSTIDLSEDALSGNDLTFKAGFADGSSAIYVASVPEPVAPLTGFVFGLILLRRKRRDVVRTKQ